MNFITGNKTNSFKPPIKTIPTLIGLGLILGGITYRLRYTSVSEPEAVEVMPEIKTVTALGRIEPSGEIIEISISSSAEGNRIEELLVRQGDKIERGEIVAILDSRDRLEAALNQAKEQVLVTEANLARVKAGAKTGEIQAQQAAIARLQTERNNNIAAQKATVSRIEAELNNARIEYRRYEQLYRQGGISASEKDRRYLTLATAQQQLAEAKANLERIESAQQEQITEAKATLDKIAEVRPVDVAVAAAEVRQAKAAVQTAQAELNRAYIKSPQAGRIIKILTRPGEAVASGEGLARIGQISQMYAVAEVYESDITKVQLGQPVTVTSDAITEPLTGIVESIGLEVERQEVINTDPTANVDAKVVEVKVKLDEASSEKVAGLTNLLVNVQIDL